MQGVMIPFDAFEDMRIGVYDGAHGEPISPPLEKGEPKKGWYLIAIDFAQCMTVEAADGEDEEPQTEVDRALCILWARPKPLGGALESAASAKEPEAKPAQQVAADEPQSEVKE